MLFTKKFNIKDKQIEFFDINVYTDTKNFVDPYCISQTSTQTGKDAQQYINLFMTELLASIQNQVDTRSSYLCSKFNEPNGTRLGYSKVKKDGSGAGSHLAEIFLQELKNIRDIIKLGIFKYLEECQLLCNELRYDRISDITINIVKLPLIQFTQAQCSKHGIKIRKTKSTISYFCVKTDSWKKDHFELPHIDNSENFIILIPKTFIPKIPTYNPMYFYNNTAQEHFKKQAIIKNDSCISMDRKGNIQVLSKDLKISENYKPTKVNIKRGIMENPKLLIKFRNEVAMDLYNRNFRK